MQQYRELIEKILKDGEVKQDRTGTGTKSIFGHQMRFDLNEGFPLLTLKKTFWKGTVKELLWFLSGSTDVTDLQKDGVRFWDSWVDENNTIGPGYGRQFRRIEYTTSIVPKIFERPRSFDHKVLEPMKLVHGSASGKYTWKIGQHVKTQKSGVCVICEELRSSPQQRQVLWKVYFPYAGSYQLVNYRQLLTGNIHDPFQRDYHSVGYLGYHDPNDPNFAMLYRTWRKMLKACYGMQDGLFHRSSSEHVVESWLNFSQFQKDAKKIPGWELKQEFPKDYSLDKNILWASNRFGPDTCLWASAEELKLNAEDTQKGFLDGDIGRSPVFGTLAKSLQHLGSDLKLFLERVFSFLRPLTHRGVEVGDGKVLRTRVIDQLKQTIASIKHMPHSRRHIISLWNIHDVDRMKLPPCHGNMIQFYVRGGKLSCQMYQRSADVFLGLPVNIASYALLTHMMARECGLEVGELVLTIGDAHLYLNHLDQAKECALRDDRPLPKLYLDPNIKRVLDFKIEDCRVDGYDPHPLISAPVSV